MQGDMHSLSASVQHRKQAAAGHLWAKETIDEYD
jgi:hypothetical protein